MVFARKPAPVQVSYLGYPGTTGVETIDYRLTDPYLEPPTVGSNDGAVGKERAIRLPHTFWCYPEPPEAPAVGPLPARDSDVVTFGSLNIFSKVNAGVIEVWSEILGRVPNSQLMLHCFKGEQRERAIGEFAGHGVGRERIRFVEPLPMEEYFAQYNAIDIGLDPFPYPGGTTTCDALWMGVPVVTLAGKTALSRGGVSILSNVGCAELIARSVDEYVSKAVTLAGDRERLEAMRMFMREQMRRSPLMDGRRFAGDVEDAFRGMGKRRLLSAEC
jgi:predicted O-linked N-acetylglucosamine transferase (SPINDLY family)